MQIGTFSWLTVYINCLHTSVCFRRLILALPTRISGEVQDLCPIRQKLSILPQIAEYSTYSSEIRSVMSSVYYRRYNAMLEQTEDRTTGPCTPGVPRGPGGPLITSPGRHSNNTSTLLFN